jgi:thiosulfate dehydrogenase [quinone] large subunit
LPGRPFGGFDPAPRSEGARLLPPPPPAPVGSARRREPAAGPSLREQLATATVSARALLPVRLFFGATFLYAGADKLIDPTFLDASSAASIVAQMTAFARISPLAPIVRLGEPYAIPIGILVALAEIAIGLGTLSGLAFRLAAVGGATLSLLFFLTASWSTHPYYYGPDLPYAFGWIALALAGHAGLVPRAVRDIGAAGTADDPRIGAGYRGRSSRQMDEPVSPLRRQLLQIGTLAAGTLAAASLAIPLRAARGKGEGGIASASDAPSTSAVSVPPSIAATSRPSLSPGPSGTPGFTPSGLTVATIASVDKKGVLGFRIPISAPASLPAGDPAAILKLKDGSYVAFDLTCTHEGCRVGWDAQEGVLLCPCHGAAFDPENHAAVLGGPTDQPLLELPLVIDAKAGTISLKG